MNRARYILILLIINGACDDEAPAGGDAAAQDGTADRTATDGAKGVDGSGGDGGGTTKDGGGTTKDGGGTTKDGGGDGGGTTKDGGGTTKDGGSGTSDWFSIPDAANPGNMGTCFGKVYACGDGKDNDGDKLIDASDPECTGPCDNDEGSFELKIPGVNVDPCKQDCYWDNNSGNGNDKCDWSHKCDPKNPGATLKPPCVYDPKYNKCNDPAPPQCLKNCLPITPNGCDCFGCCEIYTPKGKYKETVFLGSGSSCTVKTPQNCRACTQVTACLNQCGTCELCLGKTISDLPPSCFKPPGTDSGTPPKKDGGGGAKDSGGTVKDGGGTGNDNGGTGNDSGGTGNDSGGTGNDSGGTGNDSGGTKDGGGTKDSGSPKDSGGATDGIVFLPWLCGFGQTPCLTNNDCQSNYHCITGCCTLVLF